jgi:hypothetical protein
MRLVTSLKFGITFEWTQQHYVIIIIITVVGVKTYEVEGTPAAAQR